MKIQNCKILKSKAVFWGVDETTTIRLKLYNAKEEYQREIGNTSEQKRFLRFGKAISSSDLKGKIIREVRNFDNKVVGFGDPIEDEFFLENDPEKTYTEEELSKMNL